jgi:hypothetical protein
MEPRDTLNTTVSSGLLAAVTIFSESQDGTSFSSASEFQNMPHSLTFTFYLPSDHQLSSHFPPIFLKPFFFYFEKTKK